VRSFADDGGGAVLVTAIKGTEDLTDGPGGTDIVLRAVEATGRPARAQLELGLLGRALEVDFAPHQLRTFRVPVNPDLPVTEVDLVEWPLPAGNGHTSGDRSSP